MMKQKDVQAEPCKGDMAKAGESGMARLLADKAAGAVQAVHGMGARRPGDEELVRLKGELERILGDSDAPSLRRVRTDIVPLRCRGDPYELGKITDMLEAVSECREYVGGEISRRGIPEA